MTLHYGYCLTCIYGWVLFSKNEKILCYGKVAETKGRQNSVLPPKIVPFSVAEMVSFLHKIGKHTSFAFE